MAVVMGMGVTWEGPVAKVASSEERGVVEEVKVVALEAAREHPLRTGTHPP